MILLKGAFLNYEHESVDDQYRNINYGVVNILCIKDLITYNIFILR